MLVHVSRFTSVQAHIKEDIDRHVGHLRQKLTRRIGHQEILSRLQRLWTKDFVPATNEVRSAGIGDIPAIDPSWNDIERILPEIISDIEVRSINGTAKDALDYEQHRPQGLKVIAIGGDKLARGLTLYGLCTSYFLRASKMYDTLMQMGRWFGYRSGYLDLCRLYTSKELIDWFEHITDAAAELREEFDLMANSGATPREFGLKVQSHPELMVTSQLKMRSARTLLLSYSGQLMQTISFSTADLDHNLVATRRFIESLGAPDEKDRIERQFESVSNTWAGHLWKDIPYQRVVNFLEDYRTNSSAHRVNSAVLADFIRKMVASGELSSWTVALLGKQSGNGIDLSSSIRVNRVKREAEVDGDRFSIGVLSDPKDETLSLTPEQWRIALAETIKTWELKKEARSEEAPISPRGPAIRMVRGSASDGATRSSSSGLLLLYILQPPKQDMPDVVAFAISFPGSRSDVKVEYKVNNVGWEQSYGASE